MADGTIIELSFLGRGNFYLLHLEKTSTSLRRLPLPRFLIRGFPAGLWTNVEAGTWGVHEGRWVHGSFPPPCLKFSGVRKNQDATKGTSVDWFPTADRSVT